MKKAIISIMCVFSLISGMLTPLTAINAAADDAVIIEDSQIPLRLQYDEEAPYGGENAVNSTGLTANDGWERWSLPIGNGYFGANLFGRTETERIQITEKTLANPYYRKDPNDNKQKSLGGLNNFSETYIDFGHTNSSVSNYNRYLDLKTAISGVSYDYNGVTYTREYFTSYPDKALVIRLDASTDGALNFVLRPTIPFEQDYAVWAGDGASKHGTVTSYLDGNSGVVELAGKMGYYDIDFLGMYRVVANGGTVSATTTTNKYGETDGTITVSGAKSAYIYVTLGTDYELTSEIFTTTDANKPTFNTTLEDTRKKVEGEFDAIAAQLEGKGFEEAYAVLKNNHLNDYQSLFGRVSVNLGSEADAALTTDALLKSYQNGNYSPYLEALYYQYGRYLLIASSRKGALPANLQGTWNRYNFSPWGSGYWHNINVQMNYWPAFNTNLAETFEAYADFNKAYMPAAQANATATIKTYNPTQLGLDGGNGWVIGTDAHQFSIPSSRSSGDLGFTTQLFWEYYEYTQDKNLLEQVIFPVLVSAARYIVKCVELDEDGNYVVSRCDSPEQHVNGVWYYTKGTTYAQSFAYQNNYNALLAAKELGIDLENSAVIGADNLCVFKRVMEQLDKYDPIKVGLSGQIKEFREEEYYGDLVDEPKHRHISQLVGLYPGNIINSNTPAWLDAAKVTLTNRGDEATGWGIAHRLNLWARTEDGDRTYQVLNKLLSTSTATNLWDLHPPFQIDGNFGGTAGIAEMLLQSHEGYISPLAAIPSAWQSGSYTGLMARGNFEVSATWSDGYADVFNVKSLSGGTASVCYSGIENAKVVKASDGSLVDYEITGDEIISFETQTGETYVITNLTQPEKVEKPATVSATRETYGKIELAWTEVENAASYNVYVAIDSQADYTLVANVDANSYEYVLAQSKANSRYTFKVTAVSAGGAESDGVLCYQNPVDVNATLGEYEAVAFDNGDLQITMKATDNTLLYKLWKKAQGESEYSLVSETSYPVIIYDQYNETDVYAVSLVSKFLHTASELYEIDVKTPAQVIGDGSVYSENLLSGKSFVANSGSTAAYNTSYGYAKLTDGIYNKDSSGTVNATIGRFATKDVANAVLDATASFDSACKLGTMRIYDFSGSASSSRAGKHITVYTYLGGVWTASAELANEAAVMAARHYDDQMGLYYIEIDLGDVEASQVRLVSANDSQTQGITLYEVTLSGYMKPNEVAEIDNLLLGKTFEGDAATLVTNYTYGYDKLTDGDFGVHTGRFTLPDTAYSKVTMECDLEGAYKLFDLKIFDHVDAGITRCKETTVEVYFDGTWKKLVDAVSLQNGGSTTFSLGGESAEKIRLTFYNSSGEVKGISIYEIECSASDLYKETGDLANKRELLNAYAALPVLSDGGEEYDAQMQLFKEQLTEFKLLENHAADNIAQMNAYNQTLLSGTHTAHNIVQVEAKAPTCTEGGWYAHERCTLCDYTTIEEILATEHSESAEWSFDDETHWKECENGCGDKLLEQAHLYSDDKDTTCDCGYARSIKYDRALYITKGDGVKTVEAAINKDYLGDVSDLAVTFLQGGSTVRVTEYALVGNRMIFTYTAQTDDALTVIVSGAGLEQETFVCELARFNEQSGQKFAVYSELYLIDANADGKTDVKDLVRTKKILAELADKTASADANGDGNITATDLTMLAKYIVAGKKGMHAQTVTFKDADGTLLEQVLIPTGFVAVPTVLPKDTAFIGWDKAFEAVTADIEYTAVYAERLPEDDSNLEGTVPEDWILGD